MAGKPLDRSQVRVIRAAIDADTWRRLEHLVGLVVAEERGRRRRREPRAPRYRNRVAIRVWLIRRGIRLVWSEQRRFFPREAFAGFGGEHKVR